MCFERGNLCIVLFYASSVLHSFQLTYMEDDNSPLKRRYSQQKQPPGTAAIISESR